MSLDAVCTPGPTVRVLPTTKTSTRLYTVRKAPSRLDPLLASKRSVAPFAGRPIRVELTL